MKVLGIKMSTTNCIICALAVLGIICVIKMLLTKKNNVELLTDEDHRERKDMGHHMPDGTHKFDTKETKQTIQTIQTTFAQLE
jgi:hypothetical protein